MLNNFWALRRELTQNNDSSRAVQPDAQTHNNHQSANSYLTTPQTMLQRPQNHHLMGVNNFYQEWYHMNNSVDAATLSIRNFPFSVNDTTSFMTAARYGRALPLGSGVTSIPQQHMSSPSTTLLSSYHTNLARNSSSNVVGSQGYGSVVTSSPQQHMSSPNTTLLSSYHTNVARNSSSNVVGSQGYANWSQNPSRPIFQNQRNFRYLPYGEGSNRRNNSFLFNDFNLHPSGTTNRFHNVNDGSMPSTTPPPFYPINNNNSNMFLSSGNANRDSTRDTSTSHRMFHIRDSEARNRSMTPPDNGFEVLQTEKKELLLFKDDKNTIPTSPVTKGDDENENDDEHLDLSLHL